MRAATDGNGAAATSFPHLFCGTKVLGPRALALVQLQPALQLRWGRGKKGETRVGVVLQQLRWGRSKCRARNQGRRLGVLVSGQSHFSVPGQELQRSKSSMLRQAMPGLPSLAAPCARAPWWVRPQSTPRPVHRWCPRAAGAQKAGGAAALRGKTHNAMPVSRHVVKRMHTLACSRAKYAAESGMHLTSGQTRHTAQTGAAASLPAVQSCDTARRTTGPETPSAVQ